jgi:hypothetical protein
MTVERQVAALKHASEANEQQQSRDSMERS